MALAPSTRPTLMGRRYMVSSGHYLASLAGARIFEAGGNAIDAGVATGLAINVVQSDLTNVGGVAPMIVRRADGRVETISGLGHWPASTDVAHLRRLGEIPRGVLRTVVPAAVDSWLTALERHGTMRFADVAAPAIELAADGFAMHHVMRDTIAEPAAIEAVREWPASRAIFLGADGDPLPLGTPVVQRELANTLRMLVEAESGATSRTAGLEAVRARFYRGDIAERMVAFVQEGGGWLEMQDLAGFRVEIGEPVRTRYRGYEVLACGPWCQGPVVSEALNILEGYDLAAEGPGSAGAYHLVLEALKAAFSDREAYYGDPRFVDVPIDGLLSPEYAAEWRRRIDPRRAHPGMPAPGDPRKVAGRWREPAAMAGPVGPDTSYVAAVDAEGNAFSATPSDAAWDAPFVPGLGIMVSGRGTQNWLEPEHPSVVAPGKRPRLTPAPGMLLKDGRFYMAYGTPGLDMQPQAMVQLVANLVDFGMEPQQAVEFPRLGSYSFPLSSHPHPYDPGAARLESRADPGVIDELARRGHKIEAWPAYTRAAGSLGAIVADHENGNLLGAADPRRIGYAIGR